MSTKSESLAAVEIPPKRTKILYVRVTEKSLAIVHASALKLKVSHSELIDTLIQSAKKQGLL